MGTIFCYRERQNKEGMIAFEQSRDRAAMERARAEHEMRDRRDMEIRAREERAYIIEKERLAREAREERDSRERRAQEQERQREQQRQQILEKKRQEQAVHKHFEESLRLAQNKVRRWLHCKATLLDYSPPVLCQIQSVRN